jgi:hypothetical protein
MLIRFRFATRLLLALVLFSITGRAAAQGVIGYGVTANGTLFRFDPANPAAAVTIGSMGIVPEGIDFRPTTTAGDPNRPLYAIDVGATTTQLYTVNTTTAAVTPVGAGFPTVLAGTYDLSGSQRFGFDFNPGTQMADGSIRIRLISTNGVNLRLNSDTGAVAATDTALAYVGGSSPFADAIAYINSNKAVTGGITILFDMDARTDVFSRQDPPNSGTLNIIGPFGAGIDANPGIAFDILSDPLDADTTINGDHGYAALARTEFEGGAYRLYDVNLATGEVTNPRAVGANLDFTGGLAMTYVPEPAALLLSLAAGVVLIGRRAKR